MKRFILWVERDPRRHMALFVLCLLGLFLVLLAVSGCGSGAEDPDASEKPRETPSRALDEPGTDACNKFARWLAGDQAPATRPEVARDVHAIASNSNSGALDDKGEVLFRVSSANNTQWTLAADAFAYECQSLGWTADDAN